MSEIASLFDDVHKLSQLEHALATFRVPRTLGFNDLMSEQVLEDSLLNDQFPNREGAKLLAEFRQRYVPIWYRVERANLVTNPHVRAACARVAYNAPGNESRRFRYEKAEPTELPYDPYRSKQ